MTLDIVEIPGANGDLGLAVTQVAKAGNLVATQIGSLEYAPTFGVDLKFFLESELRFPTESFKAYLIQRMAEHQINVSQVLHVVESLSQQLTFRVGDNELPDGGFIV